MTSVFVLTGHSVSSQNIMKLNNQQHHQPPGPTRHHSHAMASMLSRLTSNRTSVSLWFQLNATVDLKLGHPNAQSEITHLLHDLKGKRVQT